MSCISQKPFSSAALIMSRAFQPILVSTALLLIVSLLSSGTVYYRLSWFAVTAVVATGFPLLFILLGIRVGKAESLDLRHRLQRPLPLVVTLACSGAAALLVRLAHGPWELGVAILAGLVPGVLLTAITLWWKISFHTATIAGATVVLWWLLSWWALPGVLVCAAVGVSRVKLDRHTPAQAAAGALVGAAGSLLVVLSAS